MSDCRKCAKFEECAVDEDCGLFVDKPMTNADGIRTMSDEELAELIGDNIDCNICKEKHSADGCPRTAEKNCYGVWLNWLKSQVEVDK